MSASADDAERAAARMSVVATIGYAAFLAGPPVLGLLGDRVGVLHSLLVVGALAILALAVVPAVRKPTRPPDRRPHPWEVMRRSAARVTIAAQGPWSAAPSVRK